ncbi:unnamed protein product [Candidula unifasciata]|uniref:G-protein coupled receptors family 1 profile domain-containing protein n=1 Tax=Candidula unifasciata TaxID=100452 RepID=A0A8S3ZW17_9EUPU|nr:unnamed protein product [Candidula unifasciata]
MSSDLEASVLISFVIGALGVSPEPGIFRHPHKSDDLHTNGAENTNFSNPVSEEERCRYLDELQRETTKTMVAALVYLIILAVFGLIGNSVVILVYFRKFHWSATGILIINIAWLDLFANLFAIPGDIYNMLHKWDFKNPALCKARTYCAAFTTISAAMILVALAVVRYRKVCHPHKWQVTSRNAKAIGAVITSLGALFATPHAFLNGTETRETPHSVIVGYSCSTDDKYKKTKWPMANYAFLLLLYFGCSLTIITLYILIGLTARKQRRLHNAPVNVSVPGSPYTTSQFDTEVVEDTYDQNQSNCVICGSRMTKDESTCKRTSRFGSINVNRFNADNMASKVPFQYAVRVFADRIEVRTPMVEEFFVKLQNTKAGFAERASCRKSYKPEKTRTNFRTMNIFRSKTNSIYGKMFRNLSGTDVDIDIQSATTQIDASEVSNESDPLAVFKWLDVIYCPDDGHNTFCSNCIQRETSLSFRLPFNNSLLQAIEWLRPSVIEAMKRQDDTTKRKTSDFFRASSSTIDESLVGSDGSGGFPDNVTNISDPSEEHASILRRRFRVPTFGRVSVITVGGYAACKRPTGKTTTMLVLLSAFYILGYLPHLSLKFVEFLSPRIFNNLSLEGCMIYNVLLRSYFINSAVNPIIYSLWDSNFRRECFKMFRSTNTEI